MRFHSSFMVALMLLAACTPEVEVPTLLVHLESDNLQRTFQITESMTVEEFLSDADIEYDVNRDRLNPPSYTQLVDGMRITIVRITEETICEREEIPYEREVIPNEAFEPGEERLSQAGQNGEQEVCFRVIYENGVQAQRIPAGQPQIIREPVNEVRIVGIESDVEPVPIIGTLAYINNNNAWVMKRSSTTKRILTTTSDLDSHVLQLSPDGQQLLFTRQAEDPANSVNTLWLIETTGTRDAVQLVPTDVLYAEWLPNEDNTISYSTSEAQSVAPFWDALNNVWITRIDPQTGDSLDIRQVVPESGGGLSGWWGTVYDWSSDGSTLAWARADSFGIVDDTGNLQPILEYASFRTLQNWSWRAGISWSPDNTLIATTRHGPPVGNEPADTSPVFDVVITSATGSFETVLVERAGMWASPRFSPLVTASESQYAEGYLAYLQAREWQNSVNGEYDLVVADRDGSNARIVFPPPGRPGIEQQDFGIAPQDYAWSPDGTQIAIIYQGNLWVVDVAVGVGRQLTFDGGSQHPVWVG